MLPMAQARDRKLRIFPEGDHPFKDHPALVHWQPPPRKLRVKHPLWELEEGFEPMNPEVRNIYQHNNTSLLLHGLPLPESI